MLDSLDLLNRRECHYTVAFVMAIPVELRSNPDQINRRHHYWQNTRDAALFRPQLDVDLLYLAIIYHWSALSYTS